MGNLPGASGAVVLGLDPGAAPAPLVGFAVALARAADRRLVLVSAVEPDVGPNTAGGRVPLPGGRASQRAARDLDRAEDRARRAGADVASYLKVDSPVAALLASVRPVDLLVLGRAPGDLPEWGGLGSVARPLAVAAPCDLVLVPKDSCRGVDPASADIVAREVVDALAGVACPDGPRVVLDAYAEPLCVRCLGCEMWSRPQKNFDFPRSRALLSTI